MSVPAAESSKSDGTAPSADETAPLPKKGPSKLKRAISYLFWNMAALTLPLALNQIVASPILRDRMGRDAFGGLMWVRNVAMLFGNNLANGFALPFLRDMVKMPEHEARHRLRVAMTLTLVTTAAVMLIASIGCYYVAGDVVQAHAWASFVMFSCMAVARAMEFVATVRLRVVRAVRAFFVLRLTEGIVLCVGAIFIPTINWWILGGIYFVSALVPLLVSVWFNRDLFSPGRWWEHATAVDLLKAAPNGTLMVSIDNVQLYAPSLMLGALATDADVTLLYAGSLGLAFLLPVTNLGQTVLNYLAGESKFDFNGRTAKLYAQVSLAVAVVVGLLTYFVGKEMIRYLYPNDFQEVMKFYHWIALANCFASVRSLFRPLGVKFAALETIIKLSSLTLAVQLIALAALIPLWQAAGAAIALAISSAVGMIVWLFIFAGLKGKSKNPAEDDATKAAME